MPLCFCKILSKIANLLVLKGIFFVLKMAMYAILNLNVLFYTNITTCCKYYIDIDWVGGELSPPLPTKKQGAGINNNITHELLQGYI